jgi:opacity protein-like surface antigen
MKKIYIIILLIMISVTSRMMAQNSMMGVQYSVGYTVGDFNNFIGKVAFRGMELDYHNLVTENIGVGFEIGWNYFWEEKDYATYTEGTMSLSGKQYRYCLATPFLASVNYYFAPGEFINPYLGFGVGTQYTRNDLQMGLYERSSDVFHFVMKPEIGVIINPGGNAGIYISARYYDALKSGDIGKRSYITTNIGLLWQY